MKRKKKSSITLIEILIVILLIGLIGGALAFNMRGSVDKGRMFKTEQNCARVADALMMAYVTGEFSLEQIYNTEAIREVLSRSPMIKDVETILKDGWGNPLQFQIEGEEILVFSPKMAAKEGRSSR